MLGVGSGCNGNGAGREVLGTQAPARRPGVDYVDLTDSRWCQLLFYQVLRFMPDEVVPSPHRPDHVDTATTTEYDFSASPGRMERPSSPCDPVEAVIRRLVYRLLLLATALE